MCTNCKLFERTTIVLCLSTHAKYVLHTCNQMLSKCTDFACNDRMQLVSRMHADPKIFIRVYSVNLHYLLLKKTLKPTSKYLWSSCLHRGVGIQTNTLTTMVEDVSRNELPLPTSPAPFFGVGVP